MERKNELGLDEDDLAQLDIVQEELMDILATMNANEYTEEHIVELKHVLDYGLWIVGGIVYKHDYSLCPHDDEDEDDE